MADLGKTLEAAGLKLGPNKALYFDNDETTAHSLFNIDISPDDRLSPLKALCCPDLGRTYIKVLKDAAVLLHKEDGSLTLHDYEQSLLMANIDICDWNKEPWRHRLTPLELDPLSDFLALAGDQEAVVKICSGLPLTPNKVVFFQEHKKLKFKTCSQRRYTYGTVEEGDYLYAPKNKGGKPLRILRDLLIDKPSQDIDTLILVDNAPSVCNSFLEGITVELLEEVGLSPKMRMIAVQYDYFKTFLTPQAVVKEYKLWTSFLKNLAEVRRAEEEERNRLLLTGARASSDSDGYDSYHASRSSGASSLNASNDGTPTRRSRLVSSTGGELREQEEGDLSDLEDEYGGETPSDDEKDN